MGREGEGGGRKIVGVVVRIVEDREVERNRRGNKIGVSVRG